MPSVVAVRHGGPRRSPTAVPNPVRDRSSALALIPQRFHRFHSLSRVVARLTSVVLLMLLAAGAALAQTVQSTAPAEHAGGEANPVVPALNNPGVQFLGMTGEHLLMMGLL